MKLDKYQKMWNKIKNNNDPDNVVIDITPKYIIDN